MYGTCAVLRMIGEERARQVRAGQTVKHNAALYGGEQMALAAAVLASPYSVKLVNPPQLVVDTMEEHKTTPRTAHLVRAAALIVAELERLNHLEDLDTRAKGPAVQYGETLVEAAYRRRDEGAA